MLEASPLTRRPRSYSGAAAFTLVEIMVVLIILGLLATLTVSAVNHARHSAQFSRSTATIRQLGSAALLYTADHSGNWPRSTHSYSASEPQWALGLSGYLWSEPLRSLYDPRFAVYRENRLRDPLDPAEGSGGTQSNRYSYALNVYLQLNPASDDYAGKPARWHKASLVPEPGRTVLFASNRQQSSDHFMAHFWAGTGDDLADLDRRDGGRAAYVYCDGHVAWQRPEEVFAPEAGINRWHPGLAAQR
jgi:prepilin-type N-terminal cleavage/methylation domain-containing protein/prepilin-type processing-associated H-X9-DG protein